MPLLYRKNNISLARILRKNATKEENHLWYDFLSRHPLRFQRQKAIGSYIVDFYCHKAKIVIEIDGSQHYTESGKEADAEREHFLQSLGITILRFTNTQIHENFRGVCQHIDAVISATISAKE